VTLAGHQYLLGEHPADLPRPRKGKLGWNPPSPILDAFQRLLAQPKPGKQPVQRHHRLAVVVLLDRFLKWVKANRADDTHRWYADRLQVFSENIPVDLLVTELKPFHVQQWLDGMRNVTSGTKRNYVRAVKRCLSWCVEQGLIEKNPIAHLKKPPGGRRDNVIAPEEHQQILALSRDEQFRDLCNFSWHTGARCQETIALEARHLDLANHRIRFALGEEKPGTPVRLIYLNAEAEAIVARLAARWPAGPLFRNTDDLPWTPDATNCRFRYLARKLGKKFCLTDYRHSLATRLLAAGVDALTVSILLGHSDTSMLARVYAHINHDHSYLLAALGKVAGG